MSRNPRMTISGYKDHTVTSREGRVSRNLEKMRLRQWMSVTSREGRVSRNQPDVHDKAGSGVTSREGRVSRNARSSAL